MRLRDRAAFRPAALALLTLLALLPGCSKKSQTTEPQNPGAAQQLVVQANAKLGDLLFAEINGPGPARPSDVDLNEAYSLYQQALALDPTLPAANFGVAVLGLLSLTSDPEVNDAFDEWSAYLQSHTPFEARAGRTRPLGVPLLLSDGAGSLRLPMELMPYSALSQVRHPFGVADPQLGRIQAILRDRALPKLSEAVTRLHLLNPASFQFWVTPRMQGDEGADSLEIDGTDVHALTAACELLAAACNVAVAYDLNIAAYDSSGLYTAMQPGSPWLGLTGDGSARMAAAGTSFSASLADLDLAIASLKAETDPQDDDVIRAGPGQVTLAQLDSLHVYVGHVQQSMGTGFALTANWDGDYMTPPVPLTIRLGQLFQNPIPNWKQEVPGYSTSIERRPYAVQYLFSSGNTNLAANAPGAMSYYFTYNFYVNDTGPPMTYAYGDTFVAAAVRSLVASHYAAAAATPGWLGTFTEYVSVSGYAAAPGPVSAPASWSWSFPVSTSEVFVPVIHWNAATFDDWVWPDPTFHGLLPGMTSSALLLSTFGMNATNWSRDLPLDWTGTYYRAARTSNLAPRGERSEAPRAPARGVAATRGRR